jgi:hypothetical protein
VGGRGKVCSCHHKVAGSGIGCSFSMDRWVDVCGKKVPLTLAARCSTDSMAQVASPLDSDSRSAPCRLDLIVDKQIGWLPRWRCDAWFAAVALPCRALMTGVWR